jgi:hypothetical protein
MTRLVFLNDEAVDARARRRFCDWLCGGLRRPGVIPLRRVFAQALIVILAGLVAVARP